MTCQHHVDVGHLPAVVCCSVLIYIFLNNIAPPTGSIHLIRDRWIGWIAFSSSVCMECG